jgi:phosphomannomutase
MVGMGRWRGIAKGAAVSDPIISVSGLRGIVGESLDPLIAIRYASAFVAELPPGAVVLARDGRTTGTLLADAVRSALCAAGREVLDAGIAATPTVGVLVRAHQAAGAIQISASHNPPQYNGLKLFADDGRVLQAAAGIRVLKRYHHGPSSWCAHDRIGTCRPLADTTSTHLQLILATVDVPRIRRRRFRVLLDANHGAGSVLGQRLLQEFHCQVTLLGGQPDGRFEHPAEPTEENLASVLPQVIAAGAEVGFCQDPDADRLAVIDQRGRYLGEEYTLALCLAHVLPSHRGPIVTNCATSRMAQDLALRAGVPCFQAAVGEANVTERMLETRAVFGGEGNGGPIDPRVGYVRDSFVGMALILDALASSDATIEQLAAALPHYAIRKEKFTIDPPSLPAILRELEARCADAVANRLDGLRLDWPDRWLLVRASNTEPIVRAIAEAPTAADASALCTVAGEVIQAISRECGSVAEASRFSQPVEYPGR